MALWWIGNVILFIVVVPVLLGLIGNVDQAPALLAETDETINEVTVGAVRYAGSVAKLLP